jgi:divalent metal cation (Fe/Co/Zn/Cd) transporter
MNWEIKLKPESKKLVYTEGVGSIVLNATLFILKYWVGMSTGSIAIVADAWHTLSDSLTCRFSRQPGRNDL